MAAPSAVKRELRAGLLAERSKRTAAANESDARAICAHILACPEIERASTVAAYVSVGSEPGTGGLLAALRRAGKEVLLPLLSADHDLDWAQYEGMSSLVTADRGLLEPALPGLGSDAITSAQAIVVPGLAVSAGGMRLGRGGGSYDRALARVQHDVFTAVLLYNGETGLDVPAEPHDRPVGAAASPARLLRF